MEGNGEQNAEDVISTKMKALSCNGTESTESIDVSPAPKAEVVPEFLKTECFSNWLPDVEKIKFLKVIEQNETDSDTGLSACLQVAVNDFEKEIYENCEKVHYLTLYGDVGETLELLDVLTQKVESNNEIAEDTKEGYNYLLKALHVRLLSTQKDENSLKQLDILVKDLKDFGQLPLNSQITVFRLKFMALLNFRLSRKDPSALNSLKELQPENAMWHYFLYKYYRCNRKATSLRYGPKRDEIASIAKAIELEPENLLYVITGFQNLSERLRRINPAYINTENPIVWQNKKFTSVDEVIAHMKNAALEMLDCAGLADPGYYYCLLASLFSSFLPHCFLDFELADRCIKKAFEITPNCTTINHRRGLIVWSKDRDLADSAFYLWQACAYGPKNLGARCDLIHLLLSKPREQKDVIVSSFTSFLDESNIWGEKEKSGFVFLKGCFLLMLNVDEGDILNCWIDAYHLDSSINHFKETMRQAKRYLWDKGVFNFEICRNIIYQMDCLTLTDEDTAVIMKISEHISEASEEEERRANPALRFNNQSNPDDKNERFNKPFDKRDNRKRGPYNSSRNKSTDPLGN